MSDSFDTIKDLTLENYKVFKHLENLEVQDVIFRLEMFMWDRLCDSLPFEEHVHPIDSWEEGVVLKVDSLGVIVVPHNLKVREIVDFIGERLKIMKTPLNERLRKLEQQDKVTLQDLKDSGIVLGPDFYWLDGIMFEYKCVVFIDRGLVKGDDWMITELGCGCFGVQNGVDFSVIIGGTYCDEN